MMSNKHKKSLLVGSHRISSSRQNYHDRHDTVSDHRPMTPTVLDNNNMNKSNQNSSNINNQLLNSDLNY